MKYDTEKHEYRSDNGILIPNVSNIVNQDSHYEYVKDIDKYIEYGDYVHGMVYDAFLSGYTSDTLEGKQIEKLFEKVSIKKMEQMVINERFWYAGRYDILGKIDYQTVLVEIKTGNYKRAHKMQLILYMLALQDMGQIDENIPLYYCRISKTKGFEFKEIRYTQKDIDYAVELVYRYQF